MRIGTTPTHTFTIPADIASIVSNVRVTYAQCGKKVFSREVKSLTNGAVVITLTQAETLMFSGKQPIDIQLKVLVSGGGVLTSDIITKTPYECLDREVLA